MRKSSWICLAIALGIAAAISFAEYERNFFFCNARVEPEGASRIASMMQRAEWFTFDFRSKFESNRQPHPDIAIIKITDESLKELHQWPWPRSIHARLIERLAKATPKAMAFDIFFVDPFTSDPGGDRALVEATRRNPWVVHALYGEAEGHRLKATTWPFGSLRGAARHIGYVNAFIDEDGVLRTAMPAMKIDGNDSYLLSVLATSLYLNKNPDSLLRSVPRDPHGQFYVHFVGTRAPFAEFPYQDVLAASDDELAQFFKGKVILVGSFATGTYDHYPMPNSKNAAGVLFHANIIDNLIRMNAIRYGGVYWAYALITIFALLCGLGLTRVPAWSGILIVLSVTGVYWAAAQWLFTKKNFMIDMAGPWATLYLAYFAIVIYRFFTEEREKRMVKTFFSEQVSGELLDILMNDPSVLKRAGERREMTVFFSDVAGFTSISERLQPEELVTLLNRYLTAMTNVIFENGGYVDKYMGDGIMAFWNGLLKQSDHAERACRCALTSMKRLEELNQGLEKQGLVPLKARIGVNTGAMAAGYMGSSQKKQYTVMGDHVNLGSRLEGANKAFGTAIMISEFTYEVVHDQFEVRFLDRIRVPGKAKPVKTYELLGEKGTLDERWREATTLYHEAIQLFVDRQFELARTKFLEVLQILGHDKPCETYMERIDLFVRQPPAKEWDGVFELKTK